jgi:hypothetical protein
MVEKRGWIVVAAIAAVLVALTAIWAIGGSRDSSPVAAQPPPAAPEETYAPAPEPAPLPDRAPQEQRPVAQAPQQMSSTADLDPGDPTVPGEEPLPEPRRGLEDDLDQSTGWQLGQARRRVAMLERRIQTFEANAQRLEQEGHPEYAAQQREIIGPLQESLEDIRGQLGDLETRAQNDGSMGDVQRGYDEGEPGDTDAPPINVNAPVAEPTQ